MKHDIIETFIVVVGGVIAYVVGGFDALFKALLVLMLLDWCIGGLRNLKQKKFSPSMFLWGFVNKVVALLVIVAINFVQLAMSLSIPIRESVIMILLINEILSVLKNASTFVTDLEIVSSYFENVKINILKVFKVAEQEDWNGEERRSVNGE